MKFIFFFVLLFANFVSFGQLSSSIDVLAGFNQSFRVYTNDFTPSEMARNESEIPKFNYHLGVNYNKQLASLLHFKTGVRFVSMGYKTMENDLVFGDGGATTIQFLYDYLFLEIPINLRFEFVEEKKLTPYIEAGLSPNVYLTNRAIQIQNGERRIYERMPSAVDFEKFHLSVNVAAGINYYSDTETALFFQVHYNRHLTNLVNNGGVEYQLAYGLEIGVRRSIGNSIRP